MKIKAIFFFLISILVLNAQNVNEQKYRLSEGYFKAGDYQSAEEILLEIHKSEPKNQKYFAMLIEAYRQQNKFSDMLEVAEVQQKNYPSMHTENLVAELKWRLGETSEANKTWEKIIKENKKDVNAYALIAQTQINLQVFDKAISTLKTGRDNIGTNDLFFDELSRLYVATGDYENGIEEVLNLLAQSNNLSQAQGRTYAMMTNDAAIEHIDGRISDELKRKPNDYFILELYSWFLSNSNRLDKALDIVIKLDAMKKSEGRDVVNFANTARNDGNYEVAIKAYNWVIKQGKENRYVPTALYGFSRTLESKMSSDTKIEMSEVNEIIESYNRVLKDFPNTQNSALALYRIGLLHYEYLNDFKKAEDNLLQLKDKYTNYPTSAEGLNYLGKIYIAENKSTDAENTFKFVIDKFKRHNTDEINVAKYNLALILYYEGKIDTAATIFKELATISISDIANDALYKISIIEQNKDKQELLQTFTKAELYALQKNFVKAKELYEKIIYEKADSELVDQSYLKLAEILKSESKENALNLLNKLIEVKPNSIYLDKALFNMGSIYMELGNKEKAISTFTKILSEFPNSIYLQEARQKIRFLREDNI